MNYQTLMTLIGLTFLAAGTSLLLAHILLMPVFLKRMKKHDPRLQDALNVSWLNIFDNFAAAWMWVFLIRGRYAELPQDTHRLGRLLKYFWAFPFVVIAATAVAVALVAVIVPQQ